MFQSIMFGVRRAPKACPIQKKEKKKRKGRARERRRKGKMTSVEGKGDGRISGRNRNVLLLPRTPTIEAKYARTVTDKVVVAMRKHRARANPRRERSFFPSPPHPLRDKLKPNDRMDRRATSLPAYRTFRSTSPPWSIPNFSPLSLLFSFPRTFLFSLRRKRKESLEISIDRENVSLDHLGINEGDKDG